MNETDLKKAKELMLLILKKIDKICKENEIDYFLFYGTLLGAIRHNGFIPWDDDIDICMSRNDYSKFCKIFSEIGDKEIIIQNEQSDDGFGLHYAKIMLKDTKWIELSSKNTNRLFTGVYIDLFVLDKISKNQLIQKVQILKFKIINMFILAKLNYSVDAYKGKNRILFNICKVVSKLFKISELRNRRNLICNKYNYLNNEYCMFLVYDFPGNTYKYCEISKFEKHIFENEEFYIPSHYHDILIRLYGDYMTPPPLNEIENHSVVDYDFGPYNC